MAVPKLEKIVINMGLGEAIANAKIIDVAAAELGSIAGQRPVVTRA
jgi:large subunit ribosomal protein L5